MVCELHISDLQDAACWQLDRANVRSRHVSRKVRRRYIILPVKTPNCLLHAYPGYRKSLSQQTSLAYSATTRTQSRWSSTKRVVSGNYRAKYAGSRSKAASTVGSNLNTCWLRLCVLVNVLVKAMSWQRGRSVGRCGRVLGLGWCLRVRGEGRGRSRRWIGFLWRRRGRCWRRKRLRDALWPSCFDSWRWECSGLRWRCIATNLGFYSKPGWTGVDTFKSVQLDYDLVKSSWVWSEVHDIWM